MEKLNIANLARGALLERADVEITRALENIADKNTNYKKPRKVTLTLEFRALDEDREAIRVDMQAKSSITPYNSVSTQVYIDKDENGGIVAQEYVKGQLKGQILIDQETGEIVNEDKKPDSKGLRVVGIKN